MSTDDSSAADRGSGFSAGLGALVARLRACAEDPMWDAHAEVPKALLADAASALQETADMAGHYMAQRDEARQALANQRDQMIADGWRQTRYEAPVTDCEACLTPDACSIRGQCAHYLREAAMQYRATPLQTPTGKPNGHWHVESELGHPVCDVRDEKTARLFADALNMRSLTGGVAAPPAPYRPGEK